LLIKKIGRTTVGSPETGIGRGIFKDDEIIKKKKKEIKIRG
jgi:hypothetical protein